MPDSFSPSVKETADQFERLPDDVKKLLATPLSKEKPHAMAVRCGSDEIIVREGLHSDWALLPLGGSVLIYPPGTRVRDDGFRSYQLVDRTWVAAAYEPKETKKPDTDAEKDGSSDKTKDELPKGVRPPSREEDLDLRQPLGRVVSHERDPQEVRADQPLTERCLGITEASGTFRGG